MRVRFMLLAQQAMAHTDNTMYVLGGGIEVLAVSAVPATRPQLSLAVGVAFTPDESDVEHVLEIRGYGPSGAQLFQPSRFPVTSLRHPDLPGEERLFQFVLNMQDLPFPEFGEYRFVLLRAADVCSSITLTVRPFTAAEAPMLSDWEVDLREGYSAYGRGDLSEAQGAFERVVSKYPTLATAHNNLAFVYLTRGRGEEALAGFRRAAELGYTRREILDFNIACCNYGLQRYDEALAGFLQCLRSFALIGTATLLCILDDGMMPVTLEEPGDYVALASLNASWASVRLGDFVRAGSLLGAAQSTTAVERPGRGLVASQSFVAAIAALRSRMTAKE